MDVFRSLGVPQVFRSLLPAWVRPLWRRTPSATTGKSHRPRRPAVRSAYARRQFALRTPRRQFALRTPTGTFPLRTPTGTTACANRHYCMRRPALPTACVDRHFRRVRRARRVRRVRRSIVAPRTPTGVRIAYVHRSSRHGAPTSRHVAYVHRSSPRGRRAAGTSRARTRSSRRGRRPAHPPRAPTGTSGTGADRHLASSTRLTSGGGQRLWRDRCASPGSSHRGGARLCYPGARAEAGRDTVLTDVGQGNAAAGCRVCSVCSASSL